METTTKVISVLNQKGGVGKTTSTLNMSEGLVRRGYRVLMIDSDPQGNLTALCGIDRGSFDERPDNAEMTISDAYALELENLISRKKGLGNESHFSSCNFYKFEGIDILPASRDLSNFITHLERVSKTCGVPLTEKDTCTLLNSFITSLENQYDYIFIDNGPTLNKLTVNALDVSDSILVPMCAEELSVEGLQDLIGTCMKEKRNNSRLGIEGVLVTRFDARYNSHKRHLEEVREGLKGRVKVFDTIIPQSAEIVNAADAHKSVYSNKGNKCATLYDMVLDEMLDGRFYDKDREFSRDER